MDRATKRRADLNSRVWSVCYLPEKGYPHKETAVVEKGQTICPQVFPPGMTENESVEN